MLFLFFYLPQKMKNNTQFMPLFALMGSVWVSGLENPRPMAPLKGLCIAQVLGIFVSYGLEF